MALIVLLLFGIFAWCGMCVVAGRWWRLKRTRPATGSLGGARARMLQPTAPLASGIYLYIQRGASAHQAFELPLYGEVVIQRNAGDGKPAAKVLVFDDPAISRERHCRIVVQGRQRITLEDSSSNGTIVQGQYIKHAAVELKIGDVLLIGKTSIRVRDDLQMQATARMKP